MRYVYGNKLLTKHMPMATQCEVILAGSPLCALDLFRVHSLFNSKFSIIFIHIADQSHGSLVAPESRIVDQQKAWCHLMLAATCCKIKYV